jgi:hypothetical protein
MTPELSKLIGTFATLVASYYGCAVLVSILLEIAAQITGRRARTLHRHLNFLFGERLARRILDNPLVRKTDWNEMKKLSKPYRAVKALVKSTVVPVAYIEPRDFSLALMHEAFGPEEIQNKARIRELKSPDALPEHVRELLGTLIEGTNANPAHIQERIEGWFRRDQQQLSAEYGARSRLWGLAAGTLIAALVGLDTIAIALQYAPACCVIKIAPQPGSCLTSWPGYVVSGLMISQGASFWFDVLAKITSMRSEGSRPS